MTQKRYRTMQPLRNSNGGALLIILFVFIFMAIAAGGGYAAYNKWLKKPPIKTKFATIKMKNELIRFGHDTVSPALYQNMVTIDDMLVAVDKELDRLKKIGKQFPKQKGIVSPRIEDLGGARTRLSTAMSRAREQLEKIYVTWLVDQKEGFGQIRAQKGPITRSLAEAIRNEAGRIGQIQG